MLSDVHIANIYIYIFVYFNYLSFYIILIGKIFTNLYNAHCRHINKYNIDRIS